MLLLFLSESCLEQLKELEFKRKNDHGPQSYNGVKEILGALSVEKINKKWCLNVSDSSVMQ